MYYLTGIRITLLLALILLPINTSAIEAATSTNVPPQKDKVIRLKNLPAAANLQVEINSSGKLTAALFHESELKKRPDKANSAFNSTFARRIAFSLKIEKAGHYYLILKNRSHAKTVTAKIKFKAQNDPAITRAQQTLLKFEFALFNYIDFKKFPIKITACNNSLLSAAEKKAVLCREHIKLSTKLLDKKADVSDYMFYSLLHLGGHQILTQWGLKSPDEDAVNEFTIGMLFLLNRQEKTRAVLEQLAEEYQARQIKDSDAAFEKYHIQDAAQLKQIINLIEKKSLSAKWEKMMIPRIRTKVLEKLVTGSADWIDVGLIRKELAIRKIRSSNKQDDIQF